MRGAVWGEGFGELGIVTVVMGVALIVPLNALPVSAPVSVPFLERLVSSSGAGLDHATFSGPQDASKHNASGD